jgi:hypothetical protein
MLLAARSSVLALVVVFVLGAPVVLGERDLLGEQGKQVVLGDADGLEGLVADVGPVGLDGGEVAGGDDRLPAGLKEVRRFQ